MRRASVLTAVILSVAASLVAVKMTQPTASEGATEKKRSAYDRVVQSNTIRCGYAMWPSYFDKDPNTGAFSGIFYDYMEEIGKLTGVKIEWTMEVGYGDFIEGLHSGKIDAMCAGAWANPIRAKVATIVQPLFYTPILAYVRADDNRFDGDVSKLNHPDSRIAVIDGEGSELTARQFFNKAKFIQLPQLTDPSQILMNVATGKADATLTDTVTAGQYMKGNPGTLKAVVSPYPVALYGATIWINKDEVQFKHWLETATGQLLNSGVIETIIKKHEPFEGAYYRVRPNYIDPQ